MRYATSRAAPPLNGIRERQILAGELPNTPENMVRWIMHPDSIEPDVAMPALVAGDPQAARDIAAYLYSLR